MDMKIILALCLILAVLLSGCVHQQEKATEMNLRTPPTQTNDMTSSYKETPTLTPTPPPTQNPAPTATAPRLFMTLDTSSFVENRGRNYTDDFYLNEGVLELDIRMYDGELYLVDLDNKRIIPIVQGDFDGNKVVFVNNSGKYRMLINAGWANITIRQ